MLGHMQMPAPDKILSLSKEFQDCQITGKLNLGIGVYREQNGNTPIFAAVAEAGAQLLRDEKSKIYLSPEGDAAFCDDIIDLLLGPVAPKERLGAVQSVGGAGALALIAHVLFEIWPEAKVYLPDPTWVNHVAIFQTAGFQTEFYPYYDAASGGVKFEHLLDAARGAASGDIFLMHGCCHNPTGADLTQDQWRALVDVFNDRGIFPVVDTAYQGFGESLEADAWAARYVAANSDEAAFAYSCSKNFGIYRERTGAAMFLTSSGKNAAIAQARLGLKSRNLYSMPPNHGAGLVRKVLEDSALRTSWQIELSTMRGKVGSLRIGLANALRQRLNTSDFDFIADQSGMFSLLPLAPAVIKALKTEHGIFLVEDGRINIAGLNEQTAVHFADCVAKVG